MRFVTVSVLEGMVNSDRWIVVLVVVGFGVVWMKGSKTERWLSIECFLGSRWTAPRMGAERSKTRFCIE